MPKGIDWFHFVYVNLGFAAQVIAMYFFIALDDIKNNWPKYRCNPMYMPLASQMGTSMGDNFVYCVQNMQTNFMGYLLEPINYILSNLTNLASSFTLAIGDVREMLNYIRNMFTDIVGGIFGVFLNLITEFQKIMIAITDLIGKIVGILVTMVYVMDGSVKTMNSAWNGPPGQMVRVVGNCFHPETNIKLKTGEIYYMKDLRLGDILENGSKVVALMQIDNPDKKHNLYKIPKRGVDESDIYVTASHMIEYNGNYIEVSKHPLAVKQTEIQTDWFSCLITDDHRILIGAQLFWDWDDYLLSMMTFQKATV